MKKNTEITLEREARVLPDDAKKIRKQYCKPHLSELGDLRDLTLGPTPGRNESNRPKQYIRH
jgi:hypothetical protein